MRASDLEREDRLQILALEQHVDAEAGRQVLHRLERRLMRDVIDRRGQYAPDIVLHSDRSCLRDDKSLTGDRPHETIKSNHAAARISSKAPCAAPDLKKTSRGSKMG